VLGWLNRSTFHNDHHRLFRGNYGLYFTFWDRVMGTLREAPLSAIQEASLPESQQKPLVRSMPESGIRL
jgi:sterol desaturase/sphingolipid hydroxylase (fatty acid hydroxylase superfamily)